jgi:PAS domain S-box-containing protein
MGGLSKAVPPPGGADYTISPPDQTEIDNIEPPVLVDFKLQLVDLVGEGIVIVDTTGGSMRVAHANRGFEQLTGWKASEVCGSTLQFLQGPGTNDKGVETVLLGLQSGRQVRVLLLNYRRNRTPFWNSIYTLPLPHQNGSDVSLNLRHMIACRMY